MPTFVECSSVRLVSSDASLDMHDQDVKVERLHIKQRGMTAKITADHVRKLHTDDASTVSLAKVTSGQYLLRSQVSGQQVIGTINLPDFTHLRKCVTDVVVSPVAGALAIEEKN